MAQFLQGRGGDGMVLATRRKSKRRASLKRGRTKVVGFRKVDKEVTFFPNRGNGTDLACSTKTGT